MYALQANLKNKKNKKRFMHGIPQRKCYQLQVPVCSLVVSEFYLQVLINLL